MEFWFLLKKTITFFIEPLGMVLSIFAVGLYFLYKENHRLAKLFLSSSFAILFLFSYPPFADFLVKNLQTQYEVYSDQKVKYIHVLGGGSGSRVIKGVLLHKKLEDSKLIFTGYKGSSKVSSAEYNANLAISFGVDKKSIIVNSIPKDTKEEALFIKSLLGKEKFLLVTASTHIPRSMRLFNSLGLNPIPVSSKNREYKERDYLEFPTIGSLYSSRVAMHEYFGILWSLLK